MLPILWWVVDGAFRSSVEVAVHSIRWWVADVEFASSVEVVVPTNRSWVWGVVSHGKEYASEMQTRSACDGCELLS